MAIGIYRAIETNVMQKLEWDTIADFLARFSDFNDAVLVKFVCATPSRAKGISCELLFEAKDENARSGWSSVVIQLENVIS